MSAVTFQTLATLIYSFNCERSSVSFPSQQTLWHWLTQTNLRFLAFKLGPLVPSRIGVRIYKTYSVWQLLLQLLRKAKLVPEQQRFTVQWPEGVCKSLHESVLPFQDSSNCTYHLRKLQPISVERRNISGKSYWFGFFSHVQEESTGCQQASFNSLSYLAFFNTIPSLSTYISGVLNSAMFHQAPFSRITRSLLAASGMERDFGRTSEQRYVAP